MTEMEFQNMRNDVASLGLIAVRIAANKKPKLWRIIGKSNVFENNFICEAEGELLNHFACKELRLATNAEIKAGKRL